MNINKEYIEGLSPCADRLQNYLNHYAEWSGSLSEFLDLDKITRKDKMWVFVRSVSTDFKRRFAIEVTESVLHIFEQKYPNDKRPREAIVAAKLFLDGALSRKADAAAAADAAAYAAADAAHAAAADAAAYAADAAAAAAHAAAADAAYAAAYAAAWAASAA